MTRLRIALGALMFAAPMLLAPATADASPFGGCSSLQVHTTTYITCYGPDGRLASKTECWANPTWGTTVTSCEDRTGR
ncbi:MAG: hypothetical protein WBZ37_05995 [Mycobacterium sp.]